MDRKSTPHSSATPDPAKAIRDLVCECGKVRGHETACFGAASVVDHAEAIVREAKAGIAVAIDALQAIRPRFSIRTRYYSEHLGDGVYNDHGEDY